jgi:integrase
VALYLAARARQGLKVSTLRRRLAAINAIHHRRDPEDAYSPASFQHAAVAKVMKGLRREQGVRPVQKMALSTAQLRAMVEALPETSLGLRDRALLLMGFAGGFRRSALAALDFANIQIVEDGLKVLVVRDKTDQEGKGHTVGIPFGSDPRTCPVRAYRRWIAAAGISSGPVFRAFRNQTMTADGITGQVVARIVKGAAKRAGLDPRALAGHSLRAGHVTQAARSGAAERDIMRQTGHRSVEMVRRYIRDAGLFIDNSAAKLGL